MHFCLLNISKFKPNEKKYFYSVSILSFKENIFIFSRNIFVFNYFSFPFDEIFHAKNIFLFNQNKNILAICFFIQ